MNNTQFILATLLGWLFLANIKSLPLIWHLRMIYSGIVGALESLNPSFDKNDPTSIFAVTKTTHRNLPDDWDFNIHMNNESYPKLSDIAHMHATFHVFPNASWQITVRTVRIVIAGVTSRFLREIPFFSKYFIYYRVFTWSPDGKYMYMQAIFTTKKSTRRQRIGKEEEGLGKEFESIVPEDEDVCAVLYVLHMLKRRMRFEELFALDGYDAYDERVETLRSQSWEVIKDLHKGFAERQQNLRSTRRLESKL